MGLSTHALRESLLMTPSQMRIRDMPRSEQFLTDLAEVPDCPESSAVSERTVSETINSAERSSRDRSKLISVRTNDERIDTIPARRTDLRSIYGQRHRGWRPRCQCISRSRP